MRSSRCRELSFLYVFSHLLTISPSPQPSPSRGEGGFFVFLLLCRGRPEPVLSLSKGAVPLTFSSTADLCYTPVVFFRDTPFNRKDHPLEAGEVLS